MSKALLKICTSENVVCDLALQELQSLLLLVLLFKVPREWRSRNGHQ